MQSALDRLRATRACARVLLVLCASLLGVPASAQTIDAARTRGLDWLQAQVSAGGALVGEAASVGTAVQVRSEAVLSLVQAGRTAPAALLNNLAADPGTEAEPLARKAMALRAAGSDAGATEAALQALQRSDGGVIAQAQAAGASVIDTAWALRALAGNATRADNAAAWLRQRQSASGAWDTVPRSPRVSTALALNGLRTIASRNTQAAASAAQAASWLLAQRDAGTGLWDSTVWVNALVFEAVHDYVAADAALRTQVRDYLLTAQTADGSWAQDPFATALALRALWLSTQAPSNPVFGILRGRVTDAATGQALQGVSVTLTPGTRSTTSAADGSFELRDLDAGVYTVNLQFTEYGALRASVAVIAGQTLDLGALAMLKSAGATTATVRGTIVDAITSAPLAGVAVQVSGSGSVTTAADGSYQISNVGAGTKTLSASKSGYQSASATVTFTAGDLFVFSPRLAPDNTTPPAGDGVVEGRVVDAGTGQALAGAAVTVMIPSVPDVTQTTAADGSFRFTGLSRGSSNDGVVLVNVRLVNYGEEYVLTYGLPVNVGTVRLLPSRAPNLQPDLVVSSVDKTGVATNAQRLTISGNVVARISNLGTATAPAGIVATAFEDRNRNGVFDPDADLVLGLASLSQQVLPSATANLSIPVSGAVRFRDNQIYVMVDSALTLVESNEDNNVAVCDCSTGLPFIEDFNDGVADGVRFIPNQVGSVATWKVENGYFEADTGGGAIFGSTAWRDYDAEVKVMFPDGPSNDAALAFRMLDQSNWYQLRFKASHVRNISLVRGGLNASLAEAPFPVERNRWYTLKVVVRGSTVKSYIDGVQVLTYTGLEIPNGAVGVMQDGVRVRYDDLRVFDVPLFEEYFDNPATNPFQNANFNPVGNAPASVVNGELVRSSYGSSWAGDRTWSNYSAETRLRFPSGRGNDAGMVVLADNPPSGRWVQWTLNGDLVRLGITGLGVVRATRVPVNNDPTYYYRLRTEVIGSTVKIYFDDTFLFEYPDVPWLNGAIGINQDGVVAAYDNFIVRGLRGAADLSASYVRVTDAGAGGTSRITVRVGNGGTRPVPSSALVSLYRGTPSPANLVRTVATGISLSQGEYEDVAFDITGGLAGLGQVTIVVDDDGTGRSLIAECDETNNSIQADLGALATTLAVAVAADKSLYTELDAALFTATVSNAGSFTQPAQVRFTVETAEGQPVQVLALPASVSIGAAAQAVVNGTWPAAGVLAGAYRVRAELIDAQGVVYASSLAPFSVEASNTAPVGSRISADRVQYTAAQTVQLRSRVFNATANMVVDELVATTRVLNAAGQAVFTRSEPALQLAARASREYSYALPANGVSPGEYSAQLDVRDALGNLRTSASLRFTVLGTDASGVGLRGSLDVPATLALGETAAIGYSLVNGGNAALTNVPLTLRLVDPAAGVLRGQFPLNASLAAGASQAGSVNWQASGQVGDIVAVLVATIGGREQVLAQAPFKLTAPQTTINLDLAKRTERDARVLVLMSCPVGNACNDDAACVQQRSQALSAMLTALGVPHRIVSTAADFETELRCGRWNAYWLSGGAVKLSHQAAKELREAVRRGEGLIADGVHDSRNQLLHSAAGVKQTGKLPGSNYAATIAAGSVFDAGSLATLGQPTRFELTTGQPIAQFAGGSHPAIVLNRYGEGTSVLHAYDLAAMLAAAGGSTNAQLRSLVQDTLDSVASAAGSLTQGDVALLVSGISNRGASAAGVEARATLPAGVSVVDASPAAELIAATASTPAQVVWRLTLAPDASVDLRLRVRIDTDSATTLSIPVAVSARPSSSSGAYTVQGTLAHELNVVPGASLANAAAAAIEALAPTKANDRNARDRALDAANAARTALAQGNAAAALGKWIKAADWIAGISSEDITTLGAAQLAVARALEGASDRLCRP
jgi:hypothetical protein